MARCSTMLAFGLLLLVTNVTAGPYGAYIGCFDINSMGLRPENLQTHTATGQYAVQYCASTCAGNGFSLTIISSDYSCRCAGITPPLSAKLAESACAVGGKGVAVFYNHASSDTQSCSLQEIPLSNTTGSGPFSVAYNPENVLFGGAAGPGVMRLQLAGTEGTRVEYKGASHLYGQTQVTASIPCGTGVISAFYLRSSDIYADLTSGQAAADLFSEIDFEFLSFNDNLYGYKPCSVWLNTYKEAVTRGEMLVGQSEYQSVLGWPSTQTTSSWVTYTINWQPRFVSWSMNGKVLRTLHTGDATTYWGDRRTTYESPDLPMHPVFTMWTDSRSQDSFGGKIDPTKGPHHASFQDMRRIVCSRNALASSSIGPSWLYSGMCNPAGTAYKSCHSKATGGLLL